MHCLITTQPQIKLVFEVNAKQYLIQSTYINIKYPNKNKKQEIIVGLEQVSFVICKGPRRILSIPKSTICFFHLNKYSSNSNETRNQLRNSKVILWLFAFNSNQKFLFFVVSTTWRSSLENFIIEKKTCVLYFR
jgi:hypothetical protein